MAFRSAGRSRPPGGRPIVLPRWSRYVLPVLAAVVALIVIVAVAAGVWTDFLWFRSVRYTSVFGTTYGVKWALFGDHRGLHDGGDRRQHPARLPAPAGAPAGVSGAAAAWRRTGLVIDPHRSCWSGWSRPDRAHFRAWPPRAAGGSGCCSPTGPRSGSRTRSSIWTSRSSCSTTRSSGWCSASCSRPSCCRWSPPPSCTTSTAGCGCRCGESARPRAPGPSCSSWSASSCCSRPSPTGWTGTASTSRSAAWCRPARRTRT